jgi:hypothetical protein
MHTLEHIDALIRLAQVVFRCYMNPGLPVFLGFFLPGLIVVSANAVIFFFIAREVSAPSLALAIRRLRLPKTDSRYSCLCAEIRQEREEERVPRLFVHLHLDRSVVVLRFHHGPLLKRLGDPDHLPCHFQSYHTAPGLSHLCVVLPQRKSVCSLGCIPWQVHSVLPQIREIGLFHYFWYFGNLWNQQYRTLGRLVASVSALCELKRNLEIANVIFIWL